MCTYFAAHDGWIGSWLAAKSPAERGQIVHDMDNALAADDGETFEERRRELLSRCASAPAGSSDRESLEAILWMLGYESQRLYGGTASPLPD